MTTSRGQLRELLEAGHRVVPVVRELFADGETPVGIYRKLAQDRPGTFLLESAEQGGIWSRFSFVGVASFGVLTQQPGPAGPDGSSGAEVATWIDYGLDARRALGPNPPAGPLDAVAALHARWATPAIEGLPPLTGGLVGFIGWEAIRQIEHLPAAPPPDYAVPGQALSFVSALVAIDHRDGLVQLIVTVLGDPDHADGPGDPHGPGVDVDAAWADAQARLDAMQHALGRPSPAWIGTIDRGAPIEAERRSTREEFERMVLASKRHIRDGDVFQVVLSQRFDHPLTASPLDVYRVLRTLNPSPYMYLLALATGDGEPYHIVGSSPEALVKATRGRVYMHPIAGSRPRGATPEADAALAAELLADGKEQAEHLMLVDLARNDLQKVCRAGSVEVVEFMQVERFSHIMHLVSSVEGDLRPDAGPVDVFRATFPAGTLSGAPKPRALQIIDALEPAQRGVYGGVVGYFDFAGDLDLAIAIRTATIIGDRAHVQAGAGLVADSEPATEHQETVDKAAAPLRAVAIANAMRRIGG
ncbi:MAG: anthranilate synthase component I [Microbacteriaceae bacterium]